ncbi:MAG: cell division protein FtsQ/DivIB [Verrucomicrobiales bacterium]
MFKRRTSKVRQRRQVRVLRASVTSPRILWYDLQKALSSLLRFCLVMLLLGAVGWGVWRGLDQGLLDNEEFRLQRIVLNPNPALDEIRLLEVTGIDLEGSLFDCDPSVIQDRLMALPELSQVEVTRDFPGTLQVHAVARKPFLWVGCESQGVLPRDRSAGLLVDRQGFLFPCTRNSFEEASALPVIVIGESDRPLVAGTEIEHPDFTRGLRLYRAALEADPDASHWVDEIRQYKAWGSKLVTRQKLEATFGHRDIERQMDDLLAAIEHARKKGDRLATIQLVGKRNLPVTFHEVSPPKAIPVPELPPEEPAEADLRELLNR